MPWSWAKGFSSVAGRRDVAPYGARLAKPFTNALNFDANKLGQGERSEFAKRTCTERSEERPHNESEVAGLKEDN